MLLNTRILISFLAQRMARSDRGASVVEYALLVALIAIVCLAAITLLGSNTSEKFSEIASDVIEA